MPAVFIHCAEIARHRRNIYYFCSIMMNSIDDVYDVVMFCVGIMASNQLSLVQQLDDITECPICSEHFTDPRSLPCIHAFCLRCLESYARDQQPGDQMSCPVCRKEFTVQVGGISKLPKNFFIEKLLNINKISSTECEPSVCDVCESSEEENGSEKQIATYYWIESQKHLCETCAKVLRSYTKSSQQTFVKIGDKDVLSNQVSLMKSSSVGYCDEHKDDKLSAYCNDCKKAICLVCYVDSHKQHDCSDIKKVIEKLQQQITTDIGCVTAAVSKLREMSSSVKEQKDDFVRKMSETEEEVIRKAEELKQLIECQKTTLLDGLSVKKRDIVKQLENIGHEIEQQVSFMESVKKYGEELSNKGSASDIARESNVIHCRVEELLKVENIEKSRDDIHFIDVKFMSSTLIINCKENVIGNFDISIVGKGKILLCLFTFLLECISEYIISP